MQEEQYLDFGAIRVGELKEQSIFLKNLGLYPVNYHFVMKKKVYRECFTLDAPEGNLEPQQEIEVKVQFSCQKEMKLKTTHATTDITLEILEGKTLELFQPVPINVQLNAVYSKYSIQPLNSINFGALQFNEQKTRILEIKNDGLFEFNFTLFDYNDDAARKEIEEQNEQYKEALKQLAEKADPKKKDSKKEAKKEAKKDTKKDSKQKGGEKDGLLIGSVWRVSPAVGSIPPESSVSIQVEFIGNGQKLYEQPIGLDVQGRDPLDQPQGILYSFIGESCIPGIITEDFESIFEEQIVMQTSSN